MTERLELMTAHEATLLAVQADLQSQLEAATRRAATAEASNKEYHAKLSEKKRTEQQLNRDKYTASSRRLCCLATSRLLASSSRLLTSWSPRLPPLHQAHSRVFAERRAETARQ